VLKSKLFHSTAIIRILQSAPTETQYMVDVREP
jgi:hypothetical protein